MRFTFCRVLLSVAATATAARERRQPAGVLANSGRAAPGAPQRPDVRPRPWTYSDLGATPDGTSAVLTDTSTTLKFTMSDIFVHEDPFGIVSQRAMTIGTEIKEFPTKLQELAHSNVDVLKTLLPGIKLRTSFTHCLPMILISAGLWLIFYFTVLYRDDHMDHIFPEWEPQVEAAEPPAATRALDCADIVLVFHHPDSEHSDHSQQVSVDALKEMFLYDKARPTDDAERVRGRFCAFKEFLGSDTTESDGDSESWVGRVRSAKDGVLDATIGLTERKTMIEARAALLQDVVKCLPALMGFDVGIFSSVCDNELVLAISLNRKQWISYYLSESRRPIQITHTVIKALGVGQVPGDRNTSPPYLPYNKYMANNLYWKGITASEDDRLVYRTWYDRNPNGCVMSSKDRIIFILGELQACLDLDVAKDIGMLAQWYPAHSEMLIRTLRETWADRWWSLDFVQPVFLLKDYFGSQVAFNFAWQGLFCKGLAALSVVSVAIEMLKTLPPILFGVELMKSRVMLPFALVLIVWSRIMANLWDREEEYFTHKWNMQAGHICRIQRPSFRGELCTSDVDRNLTVDKMPWGSAAFRRLCSMCITLGCCCFVMCAISCWIHAHGGELDLPSSLTLSVFVKISEFCYHALSAKLAHHENHKYEDSFHDSVVWHEFLFQAVNAYWAVVSISLNLQWSGRCVDSYCLTLIKAQATTFVLALLSCSTIFATMELGIVRLSLELENRNLKRRLGEEVANKRTSQRSFLEEQAKYSKFDTQEQTRNTLQLVLALGNVLLFGTLQPLVIPLCLVYFVVTLRVRAALLTRYTQRCVPHELVGIGAWKPAVRSLMNAGVFYSGFLLVYWGRFFAGGALVAKLSGVIMWVGTTWLLWSMVDHFVPPTSRDMHVLERRRTYVERVMMEASMHKQFDSNLFERRASNEESGAIDQALTRRSTMTWDEAAITLQRTRRRSHTRLLGQSTGDEDVAPDDVKCALLVAGKEWSSIPMFQVQGEPSSK